MIKIVIEHSQTAGNGVGGMELPQVVTQSKRSKF